MTSRPTACAGSLDDAAYAEQLAQAEARAAHTRAALDRHPDAEPSPRRSPGAVGPPSSPPALIGAVLLAGSFVPATGIANSTHVNQALADAQEAESARQDRITDLLATFGSNPTTPRPSRRSPTSTLPAPRPTISCVPPDSSSS